MGRMTAGGGLTGALAVILSLVLMATGCAGGATGPDPEGTAASGTPSPAVKLEIGVTRGITPIRVEDEIHLVYEAVLFNLAPRPLTLQGLSVRSPDRAEPLLVLDGEALAQNTVYWDAEGGELPGPDLPPQGRAAVAIWLTVPADRMPAELAHAFRVRGSSADGVGIGLELEGPRVFTDE